MHAQIDIPAEEEQVIADRREHQESRAPGPDEHLVGVADPGEQRQPFDLDGQDEENIELKIRVQVGKGKKHGAADEDVRCGLIGEQERDGHGHEIADQQEQIVPESAPVAFQRVAHQIEQIPGEKGEDRDW